MIRAARSLLLCVALVAAMPAAAQPINTCGQLVQGFPCIMFHPDGGGAYIINNTGGSSPGQRVRVIGSITPGCVSICLMGDGCIFDPMIVPCTPTCRADFDGSGGLGVQDIFSFLAAYFADSPTADFDMSGAVGVQDIFSFLAAYFAGCG